MFPLFVNIITNKVFFMGHGHMIELARVVNNMRDNFPPDRVEAVLGGVRRSRRMVMVELVLAK